MTAGWRLTPVRVRRGGLAGFMDSPLVELWAELRPWLRGRIEHVVVERRLVVRDRLGRGRPIRSWKRGLAARLT